MIKRSSGAEARSTVEIIAEARELQARHAPRVVLGILSRLRSPSTGLISKPRLPEGPRVAAR